MIGVIDASGRTNQFVHNLTNRLEIAYDRKGNATTNVYDTRGNVTSVIDAYGKTNSFAYDTNNFLLLHTDPLGNFTSYVNDTNGNVLSVTLPYPAGSNAANYTTTFTYDSYGNQTSTTLPTGAVVTNSFDANTGNLLSVQAGTNIVTSVTYNANNLVASEGDKFGTNKFGYDSFGNATTLTNALNQVITSGYDADGQITNLVESGVTSSFQYDAQGRDASADYGNGVTLSEGYQSQLDWNTVDGPSIGHMERRFDEQGRLSGWTTANGSTPSYAYDENGRLLYETNSLGAVTQYTYDLVGRVLAATNLATGAGMTYGYEAVGQRTVETNAVGSRTWFGYNPDGSLAAMTNAFTNVWSYQYATAAGCCGSGSASVTTSDPLLRQVVENRSDFGLPVQTIFISDTNKTTNSIAYVSGEVSPDQEAENYPQTISDEGGRTRTYSYTALGQLQTATDLGGNTWTNQYDSVSGALTNVLSPTGETLAYSYDALDNVKTIRYGDGFYRTNNYSTGTNLLSSVNLPSGVTVNLLYDSAGRLTNRNSTVDGTALLYYNANDVLSGMTNAAGITTNYFDSAGRLTGMDYPSGANVRYGLDLLGRITTITNKASSGGTAYVAKYQYDAVGNLTNVVDPWNGQTSFTYDQVNRKKTRTLPNGVVTTYDYDWRDRVTNIVHKIGSTVLASAGYVRANGGEPTKITREDGTYVLLSYGSALRLTNEVYYSSGGSPTATNSYGYDASGTRIRLVTAAVTYTNAVASGYRVTQVKDASTGSTVETYGYDNGGRITTITRSGSTLNFGYNTADQVTAVTNGSIWNQYTFDTVGRRVKAADQTGAQRRFLVAPTPGTDLESPQLIADSANSLKQGYVFVGDEPILRFDSSGSASRVYYLEDGMGSVIGLAPDGSPTTNNTTRLFYNGFGSLRGTSGPAPTLPTGTGGDFRFQGQWWESATDFYHMRARDYDTRTGRFLSRDPEDGDFPKPETLHPYSFADSNPYVYRDPSGLFSLAEINIVGSIQKGFLAVRTYVINYVRNEIKDRLSGAISDQLVRLLGAYLPADLNPDKLRNLKGGIAFEQLIREAFCSFFDIQGVYFEAGVREDGTPVNNGLNCATRDQSALSLPNARIRGVRRPDLIFSLNPPVGIDGRPNKAILVSEIKIRLSTLLGYLSKKQQGQLNAILNYAKRNTYARTALFASLGKGNASQAKIARAELRKIAGKRGVICIVVSIF